MDGVVPPCKYIGVPVAEIVSWAAPASSRCVRKYAACITSEASPTDPPVNSSFCEIERRGEQKAFPHIDEMACRGVSSIRTALDQNLGHARSTPVDGNLRFVPARKAIFRDSEENGLAAR